MRTARPLARLGPLLGVVGLIGCKDDLSDDKDGVDPTAGMARVALGAFTVGCTPRAGVCMAEESPSHEVDVTYDIFVDEVEVRAADFFEALRYDPTDGAACEGGPCPVFGVSWHEAARYANARSAAADLPECYACEGLGAEVRCRRPVSNVGCAGLRLPTEWEWEGAARCGIDAQYAGGDDILMVGYAQGGAESGALPAAGGQLAPNACGLFDLSGNVAEWTDTPFGAYPEGPVTDPEGPDNGDLRVVRGGSFDAPAAETRVAARGLARDADQRPGLGLRLVLRAD